MRNRTNWILLAFIVALTAFSAIVIWPGSPKRYLPDFAPWPEGDGLNGAVRIFSLGLIDDTGGFERQEMRLGLDLKGGSYVLLEADTSRLPPGTDIDDALEGVKDVLERRVNAFGVSETEITREGGDRLAVQMPGIDPDEARELLGKTAQLAFLKPVLDESKNLVCITDDGSTYALPFNAGPFVPDRENNVMTCPPGEEGMAGVVQWEPATAEDAEGNSRELTGSYLKPNSQVVGPPVQVALEFNREGDRLFQAITTELVGLPLGIFLDENLISAPQVTQPLAGGAYTITGLDDVEEARTLSIQLNAGALLVPLRAIQETEVDATLGDREVVRSVQAGLIGILAVMAFMVLYYRLPGVLAVLSLGVYVSLVLMLFKIGPVIGPVTITLAGVAGLVLSVGMAVDANILVFERLKEELRAGRNLMAAVESGFDRAWPAIRDSNVSTLITCFILYLFGDQFNAALVKGFALTLGIGVLMSMFTALTVTRTFLRLLVGTPIARNLALFGAEPEQVRIGPAAESPPGQMSRADARGAQRGPVRGWSLDFIRRRGFYYALTAAILLPGVLSLIIPPSLKPGIEFSSGATFTVQFENASVDAVDVREAMTDLGHDEARVQSTEDGRFIIRTGELEGPVGPPVGPAPPSERDRIEGGLEEALGPFEETNFNQVSEIMSSEIVRDAAIAVGAAAVAILLFIWWSFHFVIKVPNAHRYGIAAVIAAGHDALIILGVFSILGKVAGTEINTMFITGLLTIIGFSVHDTIVVFDRIRETATTNPDAPFHEVVNASLTETLARSLNTSATLLFTIGALLLLGGSTIQSFLLVLLVGVIAGTYSSIFVAAQILVSWEEGDLSGLWRRLLPWRPLPAPEA
jgi:protein-export membrane protein SecD/preprotein translocase SecF subunit